MRRRGFAALAFTLAFLTALIAAVRADNGSEPNADSNVEAGSAAAAEDDRLLLCDFESGVGDWRKSDNIKAVQTVFASDGERECLEAVSYDLDVNLIRKVSAKFGESADLAEYQSFAYDIYIQPYENDPDAEYFTRIILHSGDGSSAENIIGVPAGVWAEAKLDVSTWAGRSDVVSAEISLIVSTGVAGSSRSGFYIDNVRADDKIDRAHTERFMLDGFSVSGGSAAYDDGAGRLNISLSVDSQTEFSATVFPYRTDWETDRLRIRLENSSDADTVTIFYSTYDTDALSEDKTVTLKLDRQSALKSYYVDLGDITKLRSVSFRFPEGQGEISIASICPVSQYTAPKFQVCGNITGCTLTDDLLSIRFTGDIGREEALSNQSGTLRIYAVEPGTAPEAADLDAQPLLESPMTTKFDLTLEIASVGENITAKEFVAFSFRPDGSAALIDAPFYLDDPKRAASVSITAEHGKKGVVSGDTSLVSELRADVTMLTLDVTGAFAKRGRGESFVFRGETYYFSTVGFSQLEMQISALRGAGVGAILRLTGWSEELERELAESYASDSYASYSEYNSSPDGADFLSALCGYIAEKYCLDGSVEGIVLGECENFLGPSDGRYNSLGEMAEGLALALRRIYSALASYNSGTAVYLSISNSVSNELAGLSSEVGADELLPALCAEINTYGGFEWGLCIEDFFRIRSYGERLVGASDCSGLITILRSAGVYDTRLIFSDTNYSFPTMKTEELTPRFIESYYSAVFNSHIDAVFCVLPSKKLDASLTEAIGLVDSERKREVSAPALELLGISDWKERIEGFDEKKLPSKTTETAEASKTEPGGIKGRYGYFSFDSFSGATGFEPGCYCGELSVVGSETAQLRAKLASSLSVGAVSGMGIAHRYEYPENFSLTPVLAVTLGVESTSPARDSISVKLILVSDKKSDGEARFESEMTLTVGELSTYYIDISGFSGIKDVESIQLLVDGETISSATLIVGGVDGLSRDYNDESLESVILEERAKKRAPGGDDGYRTYLWIGGGVIVGVATALTIMLLSRKKEES